MKKNKQLFLLCNVIFFLMFLIVFPLVQTVKAAAIISVPGDYDTIQEAIDASSTGDTIYVAAGTYYENIRFSPGPNTKTEITLKSESGRDSTTIDGGGTGSVVTFAQGFKATLDGFTITNGSTSENGGGVLIGTDASPTITNCIISNNSASIGGGITVGSSASPTIDNCVITNNSASIGGGISVASSTSPNITNCTISNNEASSRGGGIIFADFSTPFLDNCVITNNFAPFGGGISVGNSASPTITNSTFQNNSATGDTAADNGGGLHGAPNSTPIITNCIFEYNTSEHNGGAMAFDSAEPTIVNCTFHNNTAAFSGGAIAILKSAPKITNCSFSNNTAEINPGGAISCNNSPDITVTNSIFWGDHPAEIACDANTVSVTYSDIQGGPFWAANSDLTGATTFPGIGNINDDPRFFDQLGGDFYLTKDSPCIDAGDNSDPDLQTITLDIEGNPRIVGPAVDMGAFEKDLDVDSPPPIVSGNEWMPSGPVGGGGGEPSGIGAPPGGIFGDILKISVIGYHLDGWTTEGIEIYMPVTQGIKALKGAQEYVRSFAPNLARIVRECFDFLERKADADKEGFLYNLGTIIFPVLGKIAEESLELIGEEQFINAAYSNTIISVEEYDKLKKHGGAVAPKTVKSSIPTYFPMQEQVLTNVLF